MLGKANISDIFIAFNIVSWLLLLLLNLYTLLDGSLIEFGSAAYLRSLALNFFLLFAFFYYQYRIFSDELREKTFPQLLNSTTLTGILVILTSLAIRLSTVLVKDWQHENLTQEDKIQVYTYFYHIQIGLCVVFMTKVFTLWKRMILYQKGRNLQILWNIFEYTLLASLILNFFFIEPTEQLFTIILGFFGILGLFFAFNLRWVAYLRIQEKWRSILMILLITGCGVYFLQLLYSFYFQAESLHFSDLKYSLFAWVMFGFVFLYALFSVLVLLFNLPTSSAVEKKLTEFLDFQRLMQILQVSEQKEKMYELLLESTSKTTIADAGWLEVRSEKGNVEFALQKNILKTGILEVTKAFYKHSSEHRLNGSHIQLIRNQGFLLSKISKNTGSQLPAPFQSALEVPVVFQEKKLGSLVLLKKERDGFDSENIEIVNTFAQLAGVAIENARLVEKTLENERYQEALTIARRVQQKLLPENLIADEHFEMSAFSQTAEEVGGDYYDLFKISPTRTALIIADVSGKGTQAAFYMAQMKGVFQSLVELNLAPDKFMQHANGALSRSLEKSYFVTASFFMVDTSEKKIYFSRAGHCPTLFYENQHKQAKFIQDKGFALGMFKAKDFDKNIQQHQISYQSGDILLLYTDGIVEAVNPQGEEYGYERLKYFLETHAKASVHQFTNTLLDELHRFSGISKIEDDYTIFLVRFN
jgi:serine phosphatase RsbU (regulator of sigma subunit)/DNA-binding transcriptional regulator of glucitol operon